jgi:hypothetical protein
MTGQELHQLILNKWGFSYDIRIRKVKDRIFLHIMWRYLEQASFPLSKSEYFEHLNAIANYLNAWGAIAQFKNFVAQTKERPRLGKAVSIPIELGDRTSEWILDEG